jgi:hypothetical protein
MLPWTRGLRRYFGAAVPAAPGVPAVLAVSCGAVAVPVPFPVPAPFAEGADAGAALGAGLATIVRA